MPQLLRTHAFAAYATLTQSDTSRAFRFWWPPELVEPGTAAPRRRKGLWEAGCEPSFQPRRLMVLTCASSGASAHDFRTGRLTVCPLCPQRKGSAEPSIAAQKRNGSRARLALDVLNGHGAILVSRRLRNRLERPHDCSQPSEIPMLHLVG